MNSIESLQIESMANDTSPQVVISLLLFFGSALAGIYFSDWIKRNIEVEKRVTELERTVHEHDVAREVQTHLFQEHDQRIREKVDYDESDEIEEKKYQGWKGVYHENYRKVEITIWRVKLSTVKKNQEWLSWDNQPNASTIVRDFYLGNSNPDFKWEITETEAMLQGKISETLVNGWDSIIKIEVTMTAPSKESLLELARQTDSSEIYTQIVWNEAFKQILNKNEIHWCRILLDI